MTNYEIHLAHALQNTVSGIAHKNAQEMTDLLTTALSALNRGRTAVVQERLEVVIDMLKAMTRDIDEVVDEVVVGVDAP